MTPNTALLCEINDVHPRRSLGTSHPTPQRACGTSPWESQGQAGFEPLRVLLPRAPMAQCRQAKSTLGHTQVPHTDRGAGRKPLGGW